MPTNYELELKQSYIDHPDDFSRFVTSLSGETIFAVDLEADSMYHFHEKVCLIQIATRKEVVLIDPLFIEDLSPLKPIFASPDIRKVFHGADYDVRCLARDFDITIENLFDTQIASRFAGILETGLESVIHKRFHVLLDKKYQKKDWSRRPISPEMMEYAARDAIYLIPLAEMLIEELKENNRLEWVLEECEILSRVRCSMDEPPLFTKFRGAGLMTRRQLAILEALLQYRKTIAEKKDRPVFKIFGNQSILKIVYAVPRNWKELEDCGAFSRKQQSMYGVEILEKIGQALEIPVKKLPVYPRKKGHKISPEATVRISALKKWRTKMGKSLGIDPSLVIGKQQIVAIAEKKAGNVRGLKSIDGFRNWQREMFGKEIVRILKNTG